jgi:surface protein
MANRFNSKETLKAAVKLWRINRSRAEEQYGNISDWDVSEITDMSDLFSGCTTFNDDISRWDVSKVTNMSDLFVGCSTFNADISRWDVSKVTNMSDLFVGCSTFNADISRWDVSKVTNMSGMFASAIVFDQPIGNWNVSNVTNMHDMFEWAKEFNQPIGEWDVSKVTNMKGMFHYAYKFNKPIGDWNVSNVTNMQEMFCEAKAFNQRIGDWDVSKVTNMSTMFQDAFEFNRPIGKWNVSNVTDMSWMFVLTEPFDEPVGFNQPIGDWDVSKVTNMEQMFAGATAFNQDIRNWNVSNVTNMEDMFLDADAMQAENRPRAPAVRPPAPPQTFRPATPEMPPPVNDYYNIAATPLEESSAIFDSDATAVDIIDTGEEFNVKTYLDANIRNIAFKVGNTYSICTKDDIENNCINSASNIIFGCSYEDTSIIPRAQNVIRDIPYINPRCFGILVGLFRLSDIKTVLNNDAIRCIEVGDYPTENGVKALNPRPVTELVTVTSLSMLGRNPNAIGALHCQAGQKMQVYSLRKIAFPPPVPSSAVAVPPPVPSAVVAAPAPAPTSWWRRFGFGNRRGGAKQTHRIQRKSNKTHSRKGKHSRKHKQTKKRGVRKTRRG